MSHGGPVLGFFGNAALLWRGSLVRKSFALLMMGTEASMALRKGKSNLFRDESTRMLLAPSGAVMAFNGEKDLLYTTFV